MKPDPLHAGDVLFLDVESEVHAMQLGACLIFDAAPLSIEAHRPTEAPHATEADRSSESRVDFDRIVDFIDGHLGSHERYRQRIMTTPIGRQPMWVDASDFDPRRHVRVERLPTGSGEEQLKARCASFVAEPMDPSHPLWAIRVIEGFSSDQVAIAIKAHHCLVDGVAGIELLQSLLALEPRDDFEKSASPGPEQIRDRTPGWRSLLFAEAQERIRAGRDLAREALEAVRRPGALLDRTLEDAIGLLHILRLQRKPASPTPLDAPNSPRRSLDWMEIEMARIQEIGRRQDSTVNDVVIAPITLALGRFLESQGIPQADQADMELRVAIPVNTRPERHRPEVGNRISMMFARIPVEERDPLRVLHRTRRSIAVAKESHVADALGVVLDLAEWTPRFVTRPLTRRALRGHPANLVVTNVRGPDRPLYLLASRLRALYPIVPLMPGQTLAIAVMSYAGVLFWGFHADEDRFPSLAGWSKELQRAFDALHAASTRPFPTMPSEPPDVPH